MMSDFLKIEDKDKFYLKKMNFIMTNLEPYTIELNINVFDENLIKSLNKKKSGEKLKIFMIEEIETIIVRKSIEISNKEDQFFTFLLAHPAYKLKIHEKTRVFKKQFGEIVKDVLGPIKADIEGSLSTVDMGLSIQYKESDFAFLMRIAANVGAQVIFLKDGTVKILSSKSYKSKKPIAFKPDYFSEEDVLDINGATFENYNEDNPDSNKNASVGSDSFIWCAENPYVMNYENSNLKFNSSTSSFIEFLASLEDKINILDHVKIDKGSFFVDRIELFTENDENFLKVRAKERPNLEMKFLKIPPQRAFVKNNKNNSTVIVNFAFHKEIDVEAKILRPFASQEQGVIFWPQIGDEVLIEFFNDKDFYLAGYFHNKKNKITNEQDNFLCKIGENFINLNKKEDSLEINVKKKIVFNVDKTNITISPEAIEMTLNTSKITMSADKINFTSVNSSLEIAGPETKINTTNFSMNAISTKVSGTNFGITTMETKFSGTSFAVEGVETKFSGATFGVQSAMIKLAGAMLQTQTSAMVFQGSLFALSSAAMNFTNGIMNMSGPLKVAIGVIPFAPVV